MTDTVKKFQIEVTQTVSVDLKTAAFTDQFMEEYRANFSPFFELEEHAQHIGQLVARGVIAEIESFGRSEFVEGYGPIGVFVSEAKITDTHVDEVCP